MNCLVACIASVIDVKPEEMPDITEGLVRWQLDPSDGRWWEELGAWLHDRNFHAIMFGGNYKMPGNHTVVAIGPQMSDGIMHAVVYRDGQPIFDPRRGEATGIARINAWLWLSPMIHHVQFGAPGTFRQESSHQVN